MPLPTPVPGKFCASIHSTARHATARRRPPHPAPADLPCGGAGQLPRPSGPAHRSPQVGARPTRTPHLPVQRGHGSTMPPHHPSAHRSNPPLSFQVPPPPTRASDNSSMGEIDETSSSPTRRRSGVLGQARCLFLPLLLLPFLFLSPPRPLPCLYLCNLLPTCRRVRDVIWRARAGALLLSLICPAVSLPFCLCPPPSLSALSSSSRRRSGVLGQPGTCSSLLTPRQARQLSASVGIARRRAVAAVDKKASLSLPQSPRPFWSIPTPLPLLSSPNQARQLSASVGNARRGAVAAVDKEPPSLFSYRHPYVCHSSPTSPLLSRPSFRLGN